MRHSIDTPPEVAIARGAAILERLEATLPPPKPRQRVSPPLVDEDGTRWVADALTPQARQQAIAELERIE